MTDMEGLPELVNRDPSMRRWGRYLDADVLIEIGSRNWILNVHDGLIVRVRRGPFVMPSWTLALRAEPQAWAEFLKPDPPAGLHDLFALVRRGALRLEGDLRPFMTHIFWFKGAFERLRKAAAPL
jgi:hypothetical protein